jgi:mRNA-degrading endonuclease RelE of RelBE toxin-antitoxin system
MYNIDFTTEAREGLARLEKNMRRDLTRFTALYMTE